MFGCECIGRIQRYWLCISCKIFPGQLQRALREQQHYLRYCISPLYIFSPSPECVEWPWDDLIKFWVNSGKLVGGSKVNLFAITDHRGLALTSQYHSPGGSRGRGLLCLAPQLVAIFHRFIIYYQNSYWSCQYFVVSHTHIPCNITF